MWIVAGTRNAGVRARIGLPWPNGHHTGLIERGGTESVHDHRIALCLQLVDGLLSAAGTGRCGTCRSCQSDDRSGEAPDDRSGKSELIHPLFLISSVSKLLNPAGQRIDSSGGPRGDDRHGKPFPRFFSQARIRPQIEIGAEVSPSVRSLDVGSFARMFESLVTAADAARGARAVGASARVENAACARRLCAIPDVLEARLAADGSAEREQGRLDNWDVVAAEVAAAQSVSLGEGGVCCGGTAARGRASRLAPRPAADRRSAFRPVAYRHVVRNRPLSSREE